MTGTLPPLLDSVVGGDMPGRSCSRAYGSNAAVPGCHSDPDLLCTSEAEILERFSDQGVTQVRRIMIKNETTVLPTKHVILTFNSPKLPTTIKADYLNSKCASPSIPSVSTSSSTTQAYLLSSASLSSIKPTTQIESRLPEPISASAAAPDSSLNTSASSLSIKTCPVPTTSNKCAALSTEVYSLSEVHYQSLQLLHPIANFLIHLKSHRK
ncbi:uncharacterized protein TNCV_2427581 [Trichonephila clavipes]|nr:uncharacterized protein TNCV_2427581 [Trichonephila clavipes]